VGQGGPTGPAGEVGRRARQTGRNSVPGRTRLEREAPNLVDVVQSVHARLRPRRLLDPPPRVAFYPYVDGKSTVRERDGELAFRLSDRLQGAPGEVLEGVFSILLCRILRLPESAADRGAVRAYREYIIRDLHDGVLAGAHDRVWDVVGITSGRAHDGTGGANWGTPTGDFRPGVDGGANGEAAPAGGRTNGHADRATSFAATLRVPRRRKHIDPVGTHRSLLESYLRVTLDMGLTLPRVPTLSWSKTRATHRFGHWDADHNAVVVSQALDDSKVPEFVLDYVLYHELLHILHPVRLGSGTKRIVHSAAFKRDEKKFPRWREGEAWLRRLSR